MNRTKWFLGAVSKIKAILGVALLCGAVASRGQILVPYQPSAGSEATVNPVFANNPVALGIISNLLAQPGPPLSIPVLASNSTSLPGTYWTLEGRGPPMPFNPFPNLAVYDISTNGSFLIDDRSVDYGALAQPMDSSTNEPAPLISNVLTFDTNGLWLEASSNCWSTSNHFTVILHNTVEDELYDVLTKTDLAGATWITALTVTGATGNATTAQIMTNGSPTLFVWGRIASPYSFYIATSPVSQEYFEGDTVTLTVETGGNTNLTFQWMFNSAPILDATNSSYTIYGAQATDAGSYTVLISDGTNSFLTAAAKLTDDGATGGGGLVMFITGPRQDYTFRSGVTYVISPYYFGSGVTLYGKTVIEAGAVLKFDTFSTNASVVILGDLECKSEPYNPAILTSIDDDASGNTLEGYGVSTGSPQPAAVGVGPYLELAYATNVSIQNLRVCFADQGITTPLATSRLDIWDCQFLECNYGVVNLVSGGIDSLHNVLFAGCAAAIGASSNSIAIEGEQVTANVEDFFIGYTPANRITLTTMPYRNSIGILDARL